MRYSPIALAILATGLLSACGGSDDTSVEQQKPAEPPVATLDFSIHGIATDAPVANALITASVGQRSFTTTADANGVYTLTFEYEAGSLSGNDMIMLNAKGTDTQGHIELASQLGSFAAVKALAGDDNALQQSESPRTAITQVSTALHLLAQEANALANDADLLAAEASVTAEDLLELAAIIKVLADNPDFTPTNDTILALLSPESGSVQSAITQYLIDNNLLDENGDYTAAFQSAYDEALADTIDDDDVTQDFTAEQIIGANVQTGSVTDDWVALDGDVFHLNADGSGTASNKNSSYYFMAQDLAVDWSINDAGKLELLFAEFTSKGIKQYSREEVVEKYGTDAAAALPNDWSAGQLSVNITKVKQEVTKLFSDDDKTRTALKTFMRYELNLIEDGFDWTGDLPSYTESNINMGVWHQADQIESHWSEAPDGTWALSSVAEIQGVFDDQPYEYLVHQKITLAEDGQVQDKDGAAAGQWRFDNNALTITQNNGWTLTFTPYDEEDGLLSAMVLAEKGEHSENFITWLGRYDQASSSLAEDLHQEMPNLLGAWINGWIASSDDPEKPDFSMIYGYTFGEDGSLSWTHAENTALNQSSGESAPAFVTYPSFSHWEANGDYGYILNGGAGHYTRTRHWEVITTLDDDRHLVLEHSTRAYTYPDDPQSNKSGMYIFPRINVLKEIDLSLYPAAYQFSVDAGLINAPAIEHKFDANFFTGKSLFDLPKEGLDACDGYTEFFPFVFHNDGTANARDICDTGMNEDFSYSFVLDNRVMKLEFTNDNQPEFIVAGPKAENGLYHEYQCWLSVEENVTTPEQALAKCEQEGGFFDGGKFHTSAPDTGFVYFNPLHFIKGNTIYAVEEDCTTSMTFTGHNTGTGEGCNSASFTFDWRLQLSAQVMTLEISGENAKHYIVPVDYEADTKSWIYCWLADEQNEFTPTSALENCRNNDVIDGKFTLIAP